VDESIIEIPQLLPTTVGILWSYSLSDKVSLPYILISVNNNVNNDSYYYRQHITMVKFNYD